MKKKQNKSCKINVTWQQYKEYLLSCSVDHFLSGFPHLQGWRFYKLSCTANSISYCCCCRQTLYHIVFVVVGKLYHIVVVVCKIYIILLFLLANPISYGCWTPFTHDVQFVSFKNYSLLTVDAFLGLVAFWIIISASKWEWAIIDLFKFNFRTWPVLKQYPCLLTDNHGWFRQAKSYRLVIAAVRQECNHGLIALIDQFAKISAFLCDFVITKTSQAI